jgi:hypothetical protein
MKAKEPSMAATPRTTAQKMKKRKVKFEAC